MDDVPFEACCKDVEEASDDLNGANKANSVGEATEATYDV